jgi:hypothetical protein
LNLSEEYEPSEIDVTVTLKDGRQDQLKEFVRIEGAKKIKEQAAKYVSLLKEGKKNFRNKKMLFFLHFIIVFF